MIWYILIAVAVVVIAFVLIVVTRPSEFHITRSARIAAPPEEVFDRVNDLRKFQEWSPWSKIDPECRMTFEGPAAGMGSSFSWAGNKKVGEGRMTITESRPGELVRFKLEFLKPFHATNTTEFTFTPEGDQTLVTWSMFGKSGFACRAFSMFMNMDKMVGKDFEKGLAQLKSLSENVPAAV